jgi:hypothetical protein
MALDAVVDSDDPSRRTRNAPDEAAPWFTMTAVNVTDWPTVGPVGT